MPRAQSCLRVLPRCGRCRASMLIRITAQERGSTVRPRSIDAPGRRESAPGQQGGARLFRRARHERPSDGRAAEQRDEIVPSHCPMPPVLSTERIAHLHIAGDCCTAGFRSALRPVWVQPADMPPAFAYHQLRDCAGRMCAAAPCTMTGISTGSRLQDHDHAE
jgi:hypothetical protein